MSYTLHLRVHPSTHLHNSAATVLWIKYHNTMGLEADINLTSIVIHEGRSCNTMENVGTRNKRIFWWLDIFHSQWSCAVTWIFNMIWKAKTRHRSYTNGNETCKMWQLLSANPPIYLMSIVHPKGRGVIKDFMNSRHLEIGCYQFTVHFEIRYVDRWKCYRNAGLIPE